MKESVEIDSATLIPNSMGPTLPLVLHSIILYNPETFPKLRFFQVGMP